MSEEPRLAVVDMAINEPSTAVAAAFVHMNTVEYAWFHSFLQTLAYDAEHESRVWRGGFVAFRGATDGLSSARNGAVEAFLKDDRADWLWWSDTDAGFFADTVDRLFEAADPVERPVVAAMTFAQREYDSDGMGGYRPIAWPVVMDWNVVGDRAGFEVRWDYPKDTLTKCDGVGSHCILIHRSVFERIRDRYGEGFNSWYSRVINPTTGELVGEDLSFCMRVRQLDIPIHVHTGVQTTHRKPIWLGEEDYWRQRALNPAPEKAADSSPKERLAPRYALIATHNRPALLLALVSSLSTQTDYIVVLDNASEPPVDRLALAEAAKPAEIAFIKDPEQPPHLSRFWNELLGYAARAADEYEQKTYDVAIFNDDAIVPAGWFDICSKALREHETAVVAHTGTVPVHRASLLAAYPYPRNERMTPWAFVVKGEAGIRADESMRWFCFDDDFNRQAIDAGGVLATPGPLVVNTLANTNTVGPLVDQAHKDLETFAVKWGGTP
jgi:hypothetical protein